MSGPELPQPIYPTPSPPANGAQHAPQAPPSPPGGPSSPYGGPPAPQGPGGTPPKKGSQQWLVIGIAAAVLVVGGVVAALALGGGGDDERAGDDRPPATTDDQRASTVQREGEPSATDGSEGRGDDLGDDAVTDAEAIVEAGFVDPNVSTRDCLVDALVQDDALRQELRGQVVFQIADDAMARNYASTVMGCTSTEEMMREWNYALGAEGLDEYQMGCLVSEASTWDATAWEEFLAISVQPHRVSELEQLMLDIFNYC